MLTSLSRKTEKEGEDEAGMCARTRHWQTGRKKCAANTTVGKADPELGYLPMSSNERDAKSGLRPRSEKSSSVPETLFKNNPSRTKRVNQLDRDCAFSLVPKRTIYDKRIAFCAYQAQELRD